MARVDQYVGADAAELVAILYRVIGGVGYRPLLTLVETCLLLGSVFFDAISGGDRATEVVAGYEKAWADFGRLDDAGHYNQMVLEDSRAVAPNATLAPWVDATIQHAVGAR